MSGVAIVRALLIGNAAVTAVVPSTRISTDELPLKSDMPSILVDEIDSNPRLTLAATQTGMLHTERVQVTAMFKRPNATPSGAGVPGLKALLALILAACPHTRGTVAGFYVDSVLPDSEGPKLSNDEAGLISQSRDFIVKWRVP